MDDYTSLYIMYIFIILYVCLPGSEIGKKNYCKTCGINGTVRDFVHSGFYLSQDCVSYGESMQARPFCDMWPFDYAASCGLCAEQMQDPSVNTSLCRDQTGRYS